MSAMKAFDVLPGGGVGATNAVSDTVALTYAQRLLRRKKLMTAAGDTIFLDHWCGGRRGGAFGDHGRHGDALRVAHRQPSYALRNRAGSFGDPTRSGAKGDVGTVGGRGARHYCTV
mgnify:CR=1 FL=1